MWKRMGLCLAVAGMGLVAGPAEARFGKSSNSSSGSGSSSSGSGSSSSSGHTASPVTRSSPPPERSSDRPHPGRSSGYYTGHRTAYGYAYGPDWGRYYYDPAWAWPYLGTPTPYFGRYYDLEWRRRPRLVPSVQEERSERDMRVDFAADAGIVAEGFAVGLGLRVEGQRLGFTQRLDVFDLATDDGSAGRDTITLVSLQPGVALVTGPRLRVRVSGGLDAAFAPSAILVGPGVGGSATLHMGGPVHLEAATQWTPFPFTQLRGDVGLALGLGMVKLRGGYRATFLSDQGRVDPSGQVNQDVLAGPYGGLSLSL